MEGVSDSISHDIKAATWDGLETHISNELAPCWVVKKFTATLRGDNLEGSVAKGCLQRGDFFLPQSCEAWLQTESYTDSGIAVIHWGTCYPHQWKIPK